MATALALASSTGDTTTGSLVNGTDVYEILSDGTGGFEFDDTSYIELDVGESITVSFETIVPTIPADAYVKQAQVLVRTLGRGLCKGTLTTAGGVSDEQAQNVGASWAVQQWYPVSLAGDLDFEDCEFTFDYLLSAPGGAPGTIRVTAAMLVITYVERPEVASVAPSGTVDLTNQPTISWENDLDPDGGAQFGANVKAWDDATFDDVGFDPDDDEGSPPLWSTSFIGSQRSADMDVALDNGTVHFGVQVSQIVGQASEWEFAEADIDIDLPAVPDLTLTPEPDAWPCPRMRLDYAGNSGDAATNGFEVQRFDYVAGEWVPLRTKYEGFDGLIVALSGSSYSWDYECPSGPATYRVRALFSNLFTGATALSGWVAESATLEATKWRLVDPLVPMQSVAFDLRDDGWGEQTTPARQSSKQPQGRPDAVVISDTPGPEQGSMVIRCGTDEERDRTKAMAKIRRTLALLPAYGHHEPPRYVTVSDQTVARDKLDASWVDERNVAYGWQVSARPSGIKDLQEYDEVVLEDRPMLFWATKPSGTTLNDASPNNEDGKLYTEQEVDDSGFEVGLESLVGLDGPNDSGVRFISGWSPNPSPPPEYVQSTSGLGYRADSLEPYVTGSKRTLEMWLLKEDPYSYATIFSGSESGPDFIAATSLHPTWEIGSNNIAVNPEWPQGSQLMRFYGRVSTYPAAFRDWGNTNTGHERCDLKPTDSGAIQHLVCQYDDATGVAMFWVDGELQDAQGRHGYPWATDPDFPVSEIFSDYDGDGGLFQVGWRGSYDIPNNECIGGIVGKVAVYPYLLTPEQIRKHYHYGRRS